MMKPIVVSYMTNAGHPGYLAMRESLSSYNWPILAIVEDQWNGWGHRLKTVLKFESVLRGAGFTHLIHLDAYDNLAVGPSSSFEEEMLAIANGGPPPALVFATEIACWPIPDMAERPKYKESRPKSHWRYAHSQFILDLNQPIPEGFGTLHDHYDDQLHCHDVYLAGSGTLDTDCRIVQSIAHTNPWNRFFELTEDDPRGRVKNILTGSSPLFIHGNGRTDMSWLNASWLNG